MLHIKLKKCSSTQSYLKNLIAKDLHQKQGSILVSALEQSNGTGRGENKWQHFANNLAMSCALKKTISPTLIPLKIGVVLAHFFKEKYQQELFLKWPNDLMDKNQNKVGGIICQLNDQSIIAGIGINLEGERIKSKQSFNYSFLFQELEKNKSSHQFAAEIYHYLQSNDLCPVEIGNEWKKLCCHQDKKVSIQDGKNSITGIFKGINKDGAAIINTNGQEQIELSGSLTIL